MQPLVPLNEGAYNLTPSDPFFLPTLAPDLDELDAIDSGLAALGTFSDVMDAVTLAAFLDEPINDAAKALADETGDPLGNQFDNLASDGSSIDAELVLAQNSIQGALTQTQGPGVKLPPLPGITIPPPGGSTGGTPPGTGGGTGATPPPSGRTAQLFFTNTTHPGSESLFHVGDAFSVTIKAWNGASISVVGTHNGVKSASTGMGTASGEGYRIITGSMSAGDVGTWHEDWYADGVPAGSLDFQVR